MVDYSSITSVVNFGSVVLAVLAVFVAIAVVYVAMRGGRWLLDAIRGSGGDYEWDEYREEWIDRNGDT